MKKSLMSLVSTILVVGALLTGCGGGSEPANQDSTQPNQSGQETAKSDTPQILRLNMHSDPPTLDPGKSTDTTSAFVIRSMFEGLTRHKGDEGPQNAAAEKIEISDDLLTYTFTLREGLKWSNGDPVTAEDFNYAWRRVLDPATAAEYAYQLYYIKNAEKAHKGEIDPSEIGIKVLDERTLQVELEFPTPYFLELTAFTTYYPVNKNVVEGNESWASDASTLIGNGPFKIGTWEPNSKITLVKNESYWDADTVRLETVELFIIEDESTELAMFENGELDWAGVPLGELPTDAIPHLRDEGRLTIHPIAGTYWYKFQTEKVPFNNAKVRKAFAYAIDRKSIVENITQAGQIPATGVLPPSMQLKEGGYFKDNDVETARKLLAEGMQELGITELPPITISYNTLEAHQKIAQAIQDQWNKAFGIQVEIRNEEWGVYLDNLTAGNYQIGRMGWLGDFNDPINFLELFKDKYGGNNDTFWEHPEFQRLLTESQYEPDPEKRKQLLQQAEELLVDEMPIAPIYWYVQAWVQSDKVKGVEINGLGDMDVKWAYIE